MYFSNIGNTELQYFHGTIIDQSFSISLTDILDSDLFFVEDMNGLYRIYPLFYYDNIICNNNVSRVLDNKCIITYETSKEQYFQFINNSCSEIVVFNSDVYNLFKTLGSSLTTQEFNSLVQSFRSHTFTDNININHATVQGTYGTYIFDLDSTTIVDTGVLITNETMSNIGTVKLVNPVFEYSSYVLHLTVIGFKDVDVGFSSESNIVRSNLDINLKEGVVINIPFNKLELGTIVSFDATVEVLHNKSYLQFTEHLNMDIDYDVLELENQLSIDGVYDKGGTKISGATIQLRDGTTVLESDSTDSNGGVSFEYTPTEDKTYDFNLYCPEDNITSSTESLTVSKHSSSLTIASTITDVTYGTAYTVSGVLTVNGSPLSSASVKLMNGNSLVESLTTDSNGRVSKAFDGKTLGTFQYRLVYDGSDKNYSSSTDYLKVIVWNETSNLTMNLSKSSGYVDDSITISGALSLEKASTTGKKVKIYQGNTLLSEITLGSDGTYTFSKTYNSITGDYYDDYTIKAVYDGATGINSANTSKTLKIMKYTTNLYIEDMIDIDSGGDIEISGQAFYSYINTSNRVISNYFKNATVTVTLEDYNGNTIDTYSLTTDNTGVFYKKITGFSGYGPYTVRAVYAGNYKYISSEKTNTVNVYKTSTFNVSHTSNSITFTLKDNEGNPIANAPLTSSMVYNGVNMSLDAETNSNGVIAFSGTGSVNITLDYDGVKINGLTYVNGCTVTVTGTFASPTYSVTVK